MLRLLGLAFLGLVLVIGATAKAHKVQEVSYTFTGVTQHTTYEIYALGGCVRFRPAFLGVDETKEDPRRLTAKE
jgi:hypothetical protein